MPNKLQNDPVTISGYQNQWRPVIIFILLIIMMASVFFSRILLSVTMIVFVIFSVFHQQIKKQVSDFFNSPVLWGMSHYVLNLREVNQNYLRSQFLTTPLENDHVRFSWMISISVLVSAWLWLEAKNESKKSNWILLAVMAWQIIFLHILAARTGLLAFYLMLFIAAIGFIIKKWKSGTGIIFLLLLQALPVIAYFSLPTFQNRVKYFMYDLPYFSKGHYSPAMNDAVRVISLKAGWEVMNDHPFSGAGFGDILNETKKWYALNYPEIKGSDQILPSSQWLIYGDGCGWPGLILFTVVMFIPFFISLKKYKWLWILLNVSVLLIFLFDISLEIQFGVFLYSFIVLWWWKQATE